MFSIEFTTAGIKQKRISSSLIFYISLMQAQNNFLQI